MKFAQLHYFLPQNVGGTKDIMSHPVQKFGGTCGPPSDVARQTRTLGLGVPRPFVGVPQYILY